MFSSNTSAVSADANYIEDVFSTWLYTGNSNASISWRQTITNGIDLSTKGGLVWLKGRSGGDSNVLYDTNRGVTSQISSNSTDAAQNQFPFELTDFNSNGFTIGSGNTVNRNGSTYASWTFREQAKFFDVVTYTGDGSATRRNISHNLGSVPGCIIVKRTDSTGTWWVYHRANSYGSEYSFELNATTAGNSYVGLCDVAPTSTTFPVNSVGGTQYVNINGATYVAYLFAHNAGGFGLTGTDNVISCGSFTTDVNGRTTVTLNYEPQWLLVKRTSGGTGNWEIADNMRGWTVSGNASLYPNLSNAENNPDNYKLNATGFSADNGVASSDFIYIAIRRGPMRTPTTGTSVFNPSTWVGGSGKTTGFPLDSLWVNYLPGYSGNTEVYARLIKASSTTTQSNGGFLSTSSTAAEDTTNSGTLNWSNTGYGQPQGLSNIYYAFRRAPSFFDVVCYTGNATVGRTVTHNLGVAPELLIVKNRAMADYNWKVYSAALGNTSELCLDLSNGTFTGVSTWNSTTPTSTQFTLSNTSDVNRNATNYVAYLFASCPGVSKVGSYTGTGALQTINCGFTGGARFVLIKRTDSTGGWFTYDSARGITSGNDPYLLMNSSVPEVTGTNYVDTTSVGFQVTAAAPAGLNANGGTYIFLAIA